ncbi:MAG: hypothetical protein U0359_05115 [Byssovorax sp.]
MSAPSTPMRAALLDLLRQAACPVPMADLAARFHGRPATEAEIAQVQRQLAALADRGAASLGRVTVEGAPVLVGWVPGDPRRLAASAPPYPYTGPPPSPTTEAHARPGPLEPVLLPGTPRWVWTLHPNRRAGSAGVIAVRRRVIEGGVLLRFELPGGSTACVPARELALRGTARTCRPAGERFYHPLLWVLDHRPSDEERQRFAQARRREQEAMKSRPPLVWLILPGEPGGPDRALRCSTRWAGEERRGEGTSRAHLEIRVPFRGHREELTVSALDLAAQGMARLPLGRSLLLVCANEPVPLLLAQVAAERRARGEEATFRADLADLFGPPPTAPITDGEGALGELGLSPPCTAQQVTRAFRRRVMADRAHPDHGGSEVELRELMRLRDLALGVVDNGTAPSG